MDAGEPSGRLPGTSVVMAVLVPAIHVFAQQRRKTWMPGTRPGMTKYVLL
jgi:hypothetical protein